MSVLAYCTPDDVQALVQLTDGFTAGSKPTLNEVQSLIDKIASEITLALRRAGYTSTITDPAALEWLSGFNAYGAGALVALVIGGHGNPNDDPLATKLFDLYKERRQELLTGDSPLGNIETDSNKPASMWTTNLADGSNPNYSDIAPMVRRDTQF